MLDIGTGLGGFVAKGREHGWQVYGVEPSEKFRNCAVPEARPFIFAGTIYDVPSSMKFDSIVLRAVIEHLPDPVEVIRRSASMLRPGGLIYVDTPNEFGTYGRVSDLYALGLSVRMWRKVSLRLAPTFRPFHLFGFSVRNLEMLLRAHGFKIRYRRVYPGLPSLPLSGMAVRVMETFLLNFARIRGLGNHMEFIGQLSNSVRSR